MKSSSSTTAPRRRSTKRFLNPQRTFRRIRLYPAPSSLALTINRGKGKVSQGAQLAPVMHGIDAMDGCGNSFLPRLDLQGQIQGIVTLLVSSRYFFGSTTRAR